MSDVLAAPAGRRHAVRSLSGVAAGRLTTLAIGTAVDGQGGNDRRKRQADSSKNDDPGGSAGNAITAQGKKK